MNRPCSHSGEENASNGASTTRPSGRRSAGCDATGRRSCSSAGEIRSVLARSAASAGSLPAAISARAASGPSASNHSSAIHSGCEWRSAASAGVASGSASTSARASRAARRSTALTSVAPRREDAFASSTDSPTAAWAGTRSRNASWKTPRRSAASTAGSSFATGRPASVSITWSSVARRWTAPYASRVASARSRAAQLPPRGLAVKRAVRVRALLEDASVLRRMRSRARARREPARPLRAAGGRAFGDLARSGKHRQGRLGGGKSPDFGLCAVAQFAGISRPFGEVSNVRPFRH